MFFNKEYNFITTHKKEDILKIVQEIKTPSENRTWRFDGSIDADAFTLLPVFAQSDEYRVRPELQGTIVSSTTGNKIVLKTRLPKSFKTFFYLAYTINILFWMFYCYVRRDSAITSFIDYRAILPVAMLVFYIASIVTYNTKAKKAIDILSTKLDLKKQN
jgi:hypothetical protein